MGLIKNFLSKRIDNSMLNFQNKTIKSIKDRYPPDIICNSLGVFCWTIKADGFEDLLKVYCKGEVFTASVLLNKIIHDHKKDEELYTLTASIWLCILRSRECEALAPALSSFISSCKNSPLAEEALTALGEFTKDSRFVDDYCRTLDTIIVNK